MPGAARKNDTISHGGEITEGSENVFANGRQVARVGDAVFCEEHGAQTITSGSSSVFANGNGVARIGDDVSCGATITSGSSNVIVGG